MRRVGVALCAAAVLLVTATGCGSEDDTTDGVASLDDGSSESDAGAGDAEEASAEEQALEFAQCMRDHGVDMPDPETGDGGALRFETGSGAGELPDQGTLDEAAEACGDLRPEGGGQLSPEDESEMQDRMLAFAQCMRDNGIDMPDPEFGGGMVRFGPPEGVDPEDPAFQEAQQTCEDEVGMGEGMRP